MKHSITNRAQRGVMLLEALIAILVFSLGILAMVGLQAVAIKNTGDAKYRSNAIFLANQVIGQMWVDRTNLSDYADPAKPKRIAWEDTIDAVLPGASGDIQQATMVRGTTTTTVVTVTVRWRNPGQASSEPDHRYVAVDEIS
jgi:type IV pilus assembly protein PilV